MKATHSGRSRFPSHNPNGRLTTTVIALASQSGIVSLVFGAAAWASDDIGCTQDVAAVHVDHGAGHPATTVTAQPGDRLGHVVRVADR